MADPLKDVLKTPAPAKPTREQLRERARVSRVETPGVTRSGVKLPVRGSGNCADHATNGKGA